MVNRPLLVIMATIVLDAAGMGLAMPVIPTLLRELTHENRVAGRFGYFMAIYPLMQFLFSTALGRLSDRYGRRPVLLVSMAGAAFDYLLMGLSPLLSVLYVGRVVAGITGANLAVATAYIADVSNEDSRARRFGYMNAAFGIGFVAGPILGGAIGSLSPRYPFLLAAVLNALNLVLAFFLLPESHSKEKIASRSKPLGFLTSVLSLRARGSLLPLLVVYFLINLIWQIPLSIWIIYGEEQFQWDLLMVGFTFASFGILHALAQAFLTGPMTRVFGERGAILLGGAADTLAYIAMAMTTQGWMVFPIMALFTAGGIAMPALQSLLSRQVDESQQGELQGALVSLKSLTEVIGPIAFTTIYEASAESARGTIWLVGVGLYVIGFPAFIRWIAVPAEPRPNPKVVATTSD